MAPRTNAQGLQTVRQARRPFVELTEGQSRVTPDDRLALGYPVGHRLVEICQVEFHRSPACGLGSVNEVPEGYVLVHPDVTGKA